MLGYAYPPLPGEIRSSWLRRLAYANDGNFQSFCNRLCGMTRLWLLDIDCLKSPTLENALFTHTVATTEQVRHTSLLSLEGILTGTIRTGGRGRFILPSNPLLRYPDNPGIQWCPLCLDEKIAYWHKNWRLSFVTACNEHECLLADRCSDCGACAKPISRGDLRCWRCGYDVRRHPQQRANYEVLNLQERLLKYMYADNENSVENQIKFGEQHSILTFRTLWLLMRLVAGGPKSTLVRNAIKHLNTDKYPYQGDPGVTWRVEALSVNARHFIMMNVSMLVSDWPNSFLESCKFTNLVWSDLLRGIDERDLPFRYRELLLQNFHSNSKVRSPTFSAKYT